MKTDDADNDLLADKGDMTVDTKQQLDALLERRTGGQINIRGLRFQLVYALRRALELLKPDAAFTAVGLERFEDVDLYGEGGKPICLGEDGTHAPPLMRADQVTPFSQQQVESLLQATQRSKYSRRDETIVRFLLDTGVRVSEMCEIKMRDVDLSEGQVRILGKGNKFRTVCIGRRIYTRVARLSAR